MVRPIRRAHVLGLALALGASLPAHADSVSGSLQNGYGRLSFNTAAKVSAVSTGGVLAISFSAKTNIDPAAIVAAMPRAITSGHADADGKTLRFVLAQPVKLHVSQIGDHAVVDLAATDFTGTMPDLVAPPKAVVKPVDVASLPEIKLRTGAYEKFTRLVFDWPRDVSYSVFPGAGKMTVRFATPMRIDVSAIARFAPPWVKNASWRIDGQSTLVEFETDSDSGYHDFKDGTHVVLDILAPKTDGAAYAPPGAARPSVTAMTPVAAPKTGVSQAQAQVIAQAAQQLAPKADIKAAAKPADPKQTTAKPDAKTADAKTADPKQEPAAAPNTSALAFTDARRTRDGAIITFKGAGPLPAAIFVRGLTAWIVLENAPAFDSSNLKPALGDFAAGVEAASSNGLGILRITLKAPAQIGARTVGQALQVEIAPNVAPAPITIGFARNQNDPRRASLSTLLPAADHAFKILDPSGGDQLTIIPTQTGQGIPAIRSFADFAVLPSASGLVITPYSDDLSVSVDMSRVSISKPTGLALTPPQMPVAMSPSALARFGDGPSYLDFKHWGELSGGSFLATERKLTQASAHASPEIAGLARLNLARFYLANGFAAEALGLLNLVQKNDPSLAGDAQLVTMRAAADYMMGRYRDAHNDLISPAFDADRHASLWRGLTEAAMEDWKDAHAHLDQASPVLNRYPLEWQAAATLADVEATLGMGRLDLADAALQRLPKNLDARQTLEADLDQARLMAAESRYPDAASHFVAVEKSGDEKLAAQAIFYHTTAALNAGALTVPQAIEQLERLRFRWRGDALELNTLRKLASLYFGRRQWRDGLKTLRVATQNFSGEDAARVAQDDMRNAFVNLFLKGGADKMKPVEALALFYDNLDLTPIGPDGDEMIRRMSDRLVQVDLLGPAENLLAYQVDKRLDGIAKAQVATRLAGVYLMDHKADKAVATIRDSQITGLPDDEIHNRLILEARAFAALKQWDNALDLIAVDQSEDTKRLRADIYWESGNWAVAGQKAEEMLDARWNESTPLTEAERGELMRAAVAYSLANDEASLTRLRAHFMPKMKGTPDANMFAVLSADLDQHGLAFRDAAAKIASVDTLESFMKDFQRARPGAKS
ncbi:MAG TPA: tetratricopeptide repeat protein [Rhizomicrobium sp.]|nr:tetratricopeptide repeat protein [Rhizomicrobium sp.]